MHVVVITDRKDVRESFDKLSKNQTIRTDFYPVKDIRTFLKAAPSGCIVYLDISSFSQAEQAKAIKNILKQKQISFGIIDPNNAFTDVASLFHDGAADYIGKTILSSGIDQKRMKKVSTYHVPEITDEINNTCNLFNLIPSSSWPDIQSGEEYTFCFMYVELDSLKEMKKTVDIKLLSIIEDRFRNLIDRYAGSIGGRIWMWEDYKGLTLFPFDGKTCESIQMAFRLMLNRYILLQEELRFNTELSYRIVLHIGNTVYRERGDTGTIISDTINTIFHIGQYFATPGNFFVTGEVVPFIPKGLEDLFIPAGNFEGKSISRMRSSGK